jgi:hypothetical protein
MARPALALIKIFGTAILVGKTGCFERDATTTREMMGSRALRSFAFAQFLWETVGRFDKQFACASISGTVARVVDQQ